MASFFHGTAVRAVSFQYPKSSQLALDDVDFDLQPGDYVAIVGANGSGKSTLLKLLVGLIRPTSGSIRLAASFPASAPSLRINPAKAEGARAARQVIGLVLQNPDNQIIAGVVEDDVAFGPVNLGLSDLVVAERVESALKAVGLWERRRSPSHSLSGGERQKLAIAAVLALGCPVLALDESLSMLDPAARRSILDLIDQLLVNGHLQAVLHVTHSMDEALRARRVMVLQAGRLVFNGASSKLAQLPLEKWSLGLPEALYWRNRLNQLLPGFDSDQTTAPTLAAAVLQYLSGLTAAEAAVRFAAILSLEGLTITSNLRAPAGQTASRQPPHLASPTDNLFPALVCADIDHVYQPNSPFASQALDKLQFYLPRGTAVALVGVAGSGKTTLLKHANAVLLPQSGELRILGLDPRDRKTELRQLRLRAALAVQQPESALFERAVADDVAFGPRKRGLTGQALVAVVRRALDDIGLAYERFRDRETVSLSGGEKRKAALAGVMALEPELLLLDEATAGLDPESCERLLQTILDLRTRGTTILASLHSMAEAARFDYVAVMRNGRLAAFGRPETIFGAAYDPAWGLERPWGAAFMEALMSGAAARGLKLLGPWNLALPQARSIVPGDVIPDLVNTQASIPNSLITTISFPDLEPPQKRRLRRRTGLEFYRNLALGQFLNQPSRLHSVGPVKKLIALVAVFSLILVSTRPGWISLGTAPVFPVTVLLIALVWPLAILLIFNWLGAVPPLFLIRNLIPALPYLGFIGLFQSLFAWPDDVSLVLLAVGPFSLTLTELWRAILLGFRLASLVILFAAFFAISPLNAYISLFRPKPRARAGYQSTKHQNGLSWRRTLAVVVALMFRCIPILQEEAERIAVAQAARGAEIGPGRLRSAAAIIVPLFLRALERAEALALAMELRLFGLE